MGRVKACWRNGEASGHEGDGHRAGTCGGEHRQERATQPSQPQQATAAPIASVVSAHALAPHTAWHRSSLVGRVKACWRNGEASGHEADGHRAGTGGGEHHQERATQPSQPQQATAAPICERCVCPRSRSTPHTAWHRSSRCRADHCVRCSLAWVSHMYMYMYSLWDRHCGLHPGIWDVARLSYVSPLETTSVPDAHRCVHTV